MPSMFLSGLIGVIFGWIISEIMGKIFSYKKRMRELAKQNEERWKKLEGISFDIIQRVTTGFKNPNDEGIESK